MTLTKTPICDFGQKAENSKIFCFGRVEDFFGGKFLRSVGVRE